MKRNRKNMTNAEKQWAQGGDRRHEENMKDLADRREAEKHAKQLRAAYGVVNYEGKWIWAAWTQFNDPLPYTVGEGINENDARQRAMNATNARVEDWVTPAGVVQGYLAKKKLP